MTLPSLILLVMTPVTLVFLPVAGIPVELTGVRPARAEVLDDVVAVGDLPLDGDLQVREGPEVPGERALGTLRTLGDGRVLRVMQDRVVREDPVEDAGVVLGPTLVDDSACDDLVLIGRHGLLPYFLFRCVRAGRAQVTRRDAMRG